MRGKVSFTLTRTPKEDASQGQFFPTVYHVGYHQYIYLEKDEVEQLWRVCRETLFGAGVGV